MESVDVLDEKITALKELHEQRFAEMDRALILKSDELARRLNDLNHAHERAIEKEREFVSREAYDIFTDQSLRDRADLRERHLADTAQLRSEIRDAAAYAAPAMTVSDLKDSNEARFNSNETRSARLVGGVIFAGVIIPLITALVVYLLTRHGVPISPATMPIP